MKSGGKNNFFLHAPVNLPKILTKGLCRLFEVESFKEMIRSLQSNHLYQSTKMNTANGSHHHNITFWLSSVEKHRKSWSNFFAFVELSLLSVDTFKYKKNIRACDLVVFAWHSTLFHLAVIFFNLCVSNLHFSFYGKMCCGCGGRLRNQIFFRMGPRACKQKTSTKESIQVLCGGGLWMLWNEFKNEMVNRGSWLFKIQRKDKEPVIQKILKNRDWTQM